MIDDDLNDVAVDQDEVVEAVMSHISVYMLTMSNARAEKVRRHMRSEAISNPRLADDADQCVRLVERVLKVIDQSDTAAVQPASELAD